MRTVTRQRQPRMVSESKSLGAPENRSKDLATRQPVEKHIRRFDLEAAAYFLCVLYFTSTLAMSDQEEVHPCKICGRKFISSSLEKHQPVCRKLSKLNRKPFDSGKQRAKGSDVNYSDVKKAQKEKELNGGIFPRPQTNWRERHETFINAVSQSKKVDYALKTGAPLPPPPKTAVPSDYVQCEYCGRNFNERAAERHIPFCRDQHSRNKPPKPPSTGMKPLTGHKPPTSHTSNRQSRSPTRSSSRSRADTRASTREREDLKERRRSLDTRETVRTKQSSPHRPSAQSASYTRNGMPPTPNRRSLSAPKTPGQSRLKPPAQHKIPGYDRSLTSNTSIPKTPKKRPEQRLATSSTRATKSK